MGPIHRKSPVGDGSGFQNGESYAANATANGFALIGLANNVGRIL